VERCRRDPKPLGTTRHGWIVDRLEHPPRLLSTCSTSCARSASPAPKNCTRPTTSGESPESALCARPSTPRRR
jgi:hypothetical protein